MMMSLPAMPLVFKAHHPFVVRLKSQRVAIFLGSVSDPLALAQ